MEKQTLKILLLFFVSVKLGAEDLKKNVTERYRNISTFNCKAFSKYEIEAELFINDDCGGGTKILVVLIWLILISYIFLSFNTVALILG